MEPDAEVLTIANETDVRIRIFDGEVTVRTVEPHEALGIAVGRESSDGCSDWKLRAMVRDVEVATLGPPVCGGDWVLTPDMLPEDDDAG